MVSRVVLAQVSERLQEWRAHTGDAERSKLAFGGVGVIADLYIKTPDRPPPGGCYV